jgi:hypothetical protein
VHLIARRSRRSLQWLDPEQQGGEPGQPQDQPQPGGQGGQGGPTSRDIG